MRICSCRGATELVASLERWDTGSISSPAQWVRDPALLWHRSKLWLWSDPWPRNSEVPKKGRKEGGKERRSTKAFFLVSLCVFLVFFCLFVCFCLFRAAPAAYGGSRARGLIWAITAAYTTATATPDLRQVCDLHHSSRQHRILNPPNEARAWTHILMDTSWVCYY